MEPSEERDKLVELTANQMHRDLVTWSHGSSDVAKVASDLARFTDGNIQLDLLTILGLECNVIGVTMMMVSVAVVMMCFSSLIHDSGRSRQNGRVLVLDELADTLGNDIEKHDKPNDNEYLHSDPPMFCKRGPTSS